MIKTSFGNMADTMHQSDDNKTTAADNSDIFVLTKVSIDHAECDVKVVIPSENCIDNESETVIKRVLPSSQMAVCLKDAVISDINYEEDSLLAENIFANITSPQRATGQVMEDKGPGTTHSHDSVESTDKLSEDTCIEADVRIINLDVNTQRKASDVVNGRIRRSERKSQNNVRPRNVGRPHKKHSLDIENNDEVVTSKNTADIQNSDGQSDTDLVVSENTRRSKRFRDEKDIREVRKFKCEYCKISPFNSEEALQRHVSRHNFIMLPNAEGLYECQECAKKFKTRTSLSTHMWIHKEKRFRCSECGKSFVQKVQLNVHIRSIHKNQKPYLCSLCGKKYSQQAGLAYHLRVHKSEEIKDRVVESEILSKHGEMQTNRETMLCCVICKEKFVKVIRWLYHLKRHLQSDAGLEVTKRGVIVNILQDNELFMKSQKVYECNRCDHVSFYSQEHMLHKELHSDENRFQCLYCKKTFSQHSSLKYHVRRIHRRLRCDACGGRYGTVKELSEHQVAEHRVDPLLIGTPYYQCKRCQYRSKQKSRLFFHMDQVHHINCANVNRYCCRSCGKSFATKYSQQIHERTHTNDHPFICCVCGKRFSDPSNLIHHGTRLHPDIPKKHFFSKQCKE